MKLSIAILCVLLIVCGSTAYSAAPKLINYQGRLTTSGGSPVTDGVYTIRFRIYADSTTATPLWEETQPVSVVSGLFAVMLGGSTALPDTAFVSTNRFLGMKVNLDAELAPRSRLVSVPYALSAADWAVSGKKAYTYDSIGIGTSQPARRFELSDSTGNHWIARFGGNSSLATMLELTNSTANRTWEIGIAGNVGDPFRRPKSFFIHCPPLGFIPFRIDTLGRTLLAGQVGIGVTLPARKLELIDSTGPIEAARFGTTSTNASAIEVYNSSVNAAWELGVGGAAGAYSGQIPPNSFYVFRQATGKAPMVIDSNGHVGINHSPVAISSVTALGTLANGAAGSYGVWALGVGNGDGIYAVGGATLGSHAISAFDGCSSSCGSSGAGSFQGNVAIVGTLSKSAGSFKIDHPLDPEHKYLEHSFVESPDMKNIYDGVVTLDGSGQAAVTMPDWFEALNQDFRYQLTAIGAPGPNLYVAQEIAGNQFRIAGGAPRMKVSWMVTGIRHDAYANAHRIPVEEDKPALEQGYYLHPDLFNKPEEMSIEWARRPELMKQIKAEREKAAVSENH